MKKLLSYTICLLFISLLAACGGGTQTGTIAANTQSGTNAATQTASKGSLIKTVIKLTADRNIAGIQLSISLPVGVAPPLLADGKADPAATVEISSSAPATHALPGATYTPATATEKGQLLVTGIVLDGFSATDTITIHLKIADGAVPVESDFKLLTFEAFDTNGAPITGLNPTLTPTIQ